MVETANIELMRLGHIRYTGPYHFIEHRHDFLQLSHIVAGSAFVLFDGLLYPMSRGDTHFYHPEHRHVIWASPDMGLELLEIRMAPLNAEALSVSLHIPPFVRDERHVLQFIKSIETEGVSREPLWRETANGHMMQLLSLLLRQQKGVPTEEGLVSLALQEMKKSLPRGITIEGLAASLHISSSQLTNQFKAELGKTPKQMMTELKLDSIKHNLLLSRGKGVSRLALRYGWDATFLRKLFRKFHGMSPSEYVKRNRDHLEPTGTQETWTVFSEAMPMVWHVWNGG